MNPPAANATPTKESVALGLVAFGREHPEIIRLELFGSVARGEATKASDVDVVATFSTSWKQTVGGFEYFGHLDELERELAMQLGRPAHLTDSSGVESSVRIGNTSLARAIARDKILVYESDDSTEGRARSHRGELPQGGGDQR